LWKKARADKAAPPADVIHVANAGDVTKQLVVTGQAATSFMWSNPKPELAKNTKDTLGVVSYPGDPKGQWARAALYFAGYVNTTHPGIVVAVINFFINDPHAGNTLATEGALPPTPPIPTREHAATGRRGSVAAYFFLAPSLIGLMAITAVPMLYSLYLTFTTWDLI